MLCLVCVCGGLQQILHFETRARLSTKDFKTLLQLAYYILVDFSSVSKAHTNTHIITPRLKPEAQVDIHCLSICPGHLLMLLRSFSKALCESYMRMRGGGNMIFPFPEPLPSLHNFHTVP